MHANMRSLGPSVWETKDSSDELVSRALPTRMQFYIQTQYMAHICVKLKQIYKFQHCYQF